MIYSILLVLLSLPSTAYSPTTAFKDPCEMDVHVIFLLEQEKTDALCRAMMKLDKKDDGSKLEDDDIVLGCASPSKGIVVTLPADDTVAHEFRHMYMGLCINK